jgi:hypothetical protein
MHAHQRKSVHAAGVATTAVHALPRTRSLRSCVSSRAYTVKGSSRYGLIWRTRLLARVLRSSRRFSRDQFGLCGVSFCQPAEV